jgi:hypothetical protein
MIIKRYVGTHACPQGKTKPIASTAQHATMPSDTYGARPGLQPSGSNSRQPTTPTRLGLSCTAHHALPYSK